SDLCYTNGSSGRVWINMTNRKLRKVNLDKKREMRTEEISEMIGEGGIGAYSYYDFPKKVSLRSETRSHEASELIDEGGLSSRLKYPEETIPNFDEENNNKQS